MALPKPVRLTDGRVCLRPPELRDVPAITEACQDAEIGRWTRVPRPYRKEHARAWIEAQPEEAAVGLLGSVGLVEADLGQRRAEVALRLRPAVVVPRMTPARASTTARSRRLS
jgi:RimJ/RimL family protein N-acetyltransferase